MFKIEKEFEFSAAHYLKDLEDGHPCAEVHGHTYKVIVRLQGKELNEANMLFDYRSLSKIVQKYIKQLDHTLLNRSLSCMWPSTMPEITNHNPTAEHIAKVLFFLITSEITSLTFKCIVESVTVKESDRTSATYFQGKAD